jgi:hypothetical protein
MIFIYKEDHGCVYTIDEETDELYYAPIYTNNTINLSEFAPVDLSTVDDEYDVLTIQQELVTLHQRYYENNSQRRYQST